MDDGTSEPRRCEVCGDPIHRDNKHGICCDPDKPECRKVRTQRKREAAPHAEPVERQCCDVCGRPLNRNNESGICGDHDSPACMRERKRRAARRAGTIVHRIKVSAGDTFGRWTALEDYSPASKLVLVRCQCGNEKRVEGKYLTRGISTSCGCSRKKPRRNKPPYLLAGVIFGRLAVLEDVAYSTDPASCRCECGVEKTVSAISLKHGNTRSCGCLRIEVQTTHGFTGHPLYQTWHGMLQRCTNPNAGSYRNYGGRNIPITVCDRWHDPWLFAEDIYREIGPRPEARDENGRVLYELDRVNNDLGYRPGNVRWADKKTQRANQRTVANLTRERDEAMRGQDALAAEVDRLTALLAARQNRTPAPSPGPDALF